MKTTWFLAYIFGLMLPGYSQVITFPYEENFAWQVKQIDEFMDRFNNADYTPIRRYLKDQYAMEEVNRLDLLKSLFDFENKAWKQEEVVKFLQDVTQTMNPPYLDFYDKDWYAKLDCSGEFQGKQENFFLVLSIQVNPETGGSKWIINSVDAAFLQPLDTSKLAFAIDDQYDVSRSLNPASFGTDFMVLVDALADTANFENYLSQDKVSPSLLSFFDKLYQRQLIFKQVNDITYHFLQIPEWVFQVEDFPRQTTNSGWLISKLIPASDEEKEAYRKTILYLDRTL